MRSACAIEACTLTKPVSPYELPGPKIQFGWPVVLSRSSQCELGSCELRTVSQTVHKELMRIKKKNSKRWTNGRNTLRLFEKRSGFEFEMGSIPHQDKIRNLIKSHYAFLGFSELGGTRRFPLAVDGSAAHRPCRRSQTSKVALQTAV